MKLQARHLTNKMKTKLYQWRHLKAKGELPNSIMETFQKEQLDHLLASNQEKAEQICHKVCQFTIQNNRIPKKKSKDKEEAQLGAWLSVQRQAKKSNGNATHYDFLQNIANQYNLTNLFDTTNYQKRAEQICHKVCQFIITNKRLPFLKSKDPEERKFAAWLDRQRQAKINNNQTVHYPSLRKIAVSYKLSSIFKISYKRKKRKIK